MTIFSATCVNTTLMECSMVPPTKAQLVRPTMALPGICERLGVARVGDLKPVNSYRTYPPLAFLSAASCG